MTNTELYLYAKAKNGGGGSSPTPIPVDVLYKNVTVQIEVNNMSVLPANVFSGFVNLQAVKLGSGLIEIGDYAFYDFRSVNNDYGYPLVLPPKLTRIGDHAFENDFIIIIQCQHQKMQKNLSNYQE